jgi:hypothetical protein
MSVLLDLVTDEFQSSSTEIFKDWCIVLPYILIGWDSAVCTHIFSGHVASSGRVTKFCLLVDAMGHVENPIFMVLTAPEEVMAAMIGGPEVIAEGSFCL